MDKDQVREVIAKRVALELKDGDVVNLGIGLPTMVPNYLPKNVHVILQSENGLLGMGPKPEEGKENPELTDAGGGYITAIEGACSFDSATSFGLIRGGHVDGMGGAMDLLVGAKKVILAMEHTAKGNHKILKECTLPLTAAGEVDMIITEMGVMNVTPEGIELVELNPEFTLDDIKAATGCELIISKNLKAMPQ